jgi:hypothetical protein
MPIDSLLGPTRMTNFKLENSSLQLAEFAGYMDLVLRACCQPAIKTEMTPFELPAAFHKFH